MYLHPMSRATYFKGSSTLKARIIRCSHEPLQVHETRWDWASNIYLLTTWKTCCFWLHSDSLREDLDVSSSLVVWILEALLKYLKISQVVKIWELCNPNTLLSWKSTRSCGGYRPHGLFASYIEATGWRSLPLCSTSDDNPGTRSALTTLILCSDLQRRFVAMLTWFIQIDGRVDLFDVGWHPILSGILITSAPRHHARIWPHQRPLHGPRHSPGET